MLQFGLHTDNIGLEELLYISTETGPEITMANKFQYFVLTKVANKNIIMIVLENMCIEIAREKYIDFVIKEKKTVGELCICRDVFCSSRITKNH